MTRPSLPPATALLPASFLKQGFSSRYKRPMFRAIHGTICTIKDYSSVGMYV